MERALPWDVDEVVADGESRYGGNSIQTYADFFRPDIILTKAEGDAEVAVAIDGAQEIGIDLGKTLNSQTLDGMDPFLDFVRHQIATSESLPVPRTNSHATNRSPDGANYSGTTPTIHQKCRDCIALFGRAIGSQTLDERVKTELEHQVGRFKIWAGNLGVFAASKASADYRLRNDEDVHQIMSGMLQRLWKELLSIVSPAIVEDSENEDSKGSESSSDSTGSLVLSLEGETELETVQSQQQFSYHMNSLQEISAVISKLYRLSAIIRKPQSHRESARVSRYIEKGDSIVDDEYEQHVKWQVNHQLPDASIKVSARLADAIIFRRKKLAYRERHQRKLSQNVDTAFQSTIIVPTIPKLSSSARFQSQHYKPETGDTATSVKSLTKSVPISATQASSVNRKGLAAYSRSIAPSNVTRSAVARRGQLDVPPPPTGSTETEAICPYCFEVVDKVKMTQSLWIRHILRDIEPYVCIFEDCNHPEVQYQTFDEWISHMRWEHTLIWTCHVSNHVNLRFETASAFKSHLQREHSDSMSPTQLQLLVDKCARPADDPLAAVTRIDEEQPEKRIVCPFCSFSTERPSQLLSDGSSIHEESKTMRDHITTHLEAIALLSLPDHENPEDAASDKLEAEGAREHDDQSESGLDSLPSTESQWEFLEHLNIQSRSACDGIAETDGYWEPLASPIVWEVVLDGREVWPEMEQDPALEPFVKRERLRQQRERLRMAGIPIIMLTDPDGIESPFFDDELILISLTKDTNTK